MAVTSTAGGPVAPPREYHVSWQPADSAKMVCIQIVGTREAAEAFKRDLLADGCRDVAIEEKERSK